MSNMDDTKCDMCKEPLDDGRKTFTLTEKGAHSVREAAESRGVVMKVMVGQKFHSECRLDFCNKKSIQSSLKRKFQEEQEPPKRRSTEPIFNFKEHCFLCGMPADTNSDDAYPVRTWDFQRSIIKACDQRPSNDPWSQKVRGRLASCIDLPAADSIYHTVCSVNFRTGKRIPHRYTSDTDTPPTTLGRKKDVQREEAFLQVIANLQENDDEQTTVTDLVNEMSKLCQDPYSSTYMRVKLYEHFGEQVVITNINGKPNIVTFRKAAAQILQEFYDTPKMDSEAEEKQRIIKAAYELIKSDIKEMDTSKSSYPDPSQLRSIDLNLKYLPESLRFILSGLFPGANDLKVATIGHCIVQASRPKSVLAPITFGLGIQLHHLYGSRFLIDSLYAHGLCISYDEVLRFSKSAAKSSEMMYPISGHFGQYIADNVDHNLRTLDGRGTFHGMGIVVACTPEVLSQKPVPRLKEYPDHGFPTAKIAIHYYNRGLEKRSPLLFQKLPDLIANDLTANLDFLWKISLPLRPSRPGWSGTMQAICSGQHPGKSSIHFLPMIDLDPTNMSCVYSTLLFVVAECKKHNTIPILTFDQPLWLKARTIIHHDNNGELKNVVLKLGSFHLMMSYLGCIGHLMNASGLREVLELVFAENAVDYILNGKAYARAIRGHTLIYGVLNQIILCEAYDVMPKEYIGSDLKTFTEGHVHPDLEEVGRIYDGLLEGDIEAKELCNYDVFKRIGQVLQKHTSRISEFPMGQLWLQYMSMVKLLLQFLKAERTGDFDLHLASLQKMLPYLAAAGHSHYTKSSYVYLTDMLKLEETNPDVLRQFQAGKFVIRRTNRFWAGLSTDLVIEQVLMRTLKSTGGLTRGRGMEEAQRTRWLLAMPACASVNESMQNLTGAHYCTSEQHKEMSESRKTWDHKDTDLISKFFQDHNPFIHSENLRSIATGVLAHSSANPHKAQEVGSTILQKMSGQNLFEYSFKKADTVKIMGQKVVSAGNETIAIPVDPQLLFQRLLLVANSEPKRDLKGLFKHELASYPASLFDAHGVMREANKPQLSDALENSAPTAVRGDAPQQIPDYYVLDGGSLLYRIPWKKDSTYEDICDHYVNHVKQHYKNATVVFDGYAHGCSTKDVTHQRRTKGNVGLRVSFSPKMPLTMKKEHFLANAQNKQSFIHLLMEKMDENGIKTLCAEGDADVLIAKTAVKCSTSACTHLIGEDTDLLVLLCFYCSDDTKGLVFRSERKYGEKEVKRRVWDIVCLREQLGKELCSVLPVIHAIGGCDTTSRLFGIGKGAPMKKFQNHHEFKSHILKLAQKGLEVYDIEKAGECALIFLCGGNKEESLDDLRARKFSEKVATSARSVQVQALPPTSNAARYHSQRVYYQAQVWMGEEKLDPTDWGWHLSEGRMLPKKMDLLPAPEYLLKVIRCQCMGDCDTQRCSCRKNGLECSVSCTGCKGTSCTNKGDIATDISDDINSN